MHLFRYTRMEIYIWLFLARFLTASTLRTLNVVNRCSLRISSNECCMHRPAFFFPLTLLEQYACMTLTQACKYVSSSPKISWRFKCVCSASNAFWFSLLSFEGVLCMQGRKRHPSIFSCATIRCSCRLDHAMTDIGSESVQVEVWHWTVLDILTIRRGLTWASNNIFKLSKDDIPRDMIHELLNASYVAVTFVNSSSVNI